MKPGLFANEILAFANPLYTVVFIGLWCLADRRGVLEDRPERIHLQINPGRTFELTVEALDWLANNSFIVRYAVANIRCIKVIKFQRHQNPHIKEKASNLPDVDGGTVSAQCQHHADTGAALLIPDSGFLIPDSGSLIPDNSHVVGGATGSRKARPVAAHATNMPRTVSPDRWLDFKLAYPARAGANPKQRAEKAIAIRLVEGSTWAEIIEGARRYSAFCDATGKAGTEYVMQAATFCGPERHYLEPWTPPPTKAETRLAGNVDVMKQFLASGT